MSTRANVCEQLKSVLDSLSPGEDIETVLEEGRASLDGWGDFWAYCGKEHKKTVKTEFNQDTCSCTILKMADASAPVAPAPVTSAPAPEPAVIDPLLTETVEIPVVDVEVEKEPESKSFFWGRKEDSE
jgi:hypothetical protein